MRMRHHNDALKTQIAKLEPETAGLQRQCEELKYAYTLSKSQDVNAAAKGFAGGGQLQCMRRNTPSLPFRHAFGTKQTHRGNSKSISNRPPRN